MTGISKLLFDFADDEFTFANFNNDQPQKEEYCVTMSGYLANPSDGRFTWQADTCDSTMNTLCELSTFDFFLFNSNLRVVKVDLLQNINF